jgi:Cu/Ag efflux pump CusA
MGACDYSKRIADGLTVGSRLTPSEKSFVQIATACLGLLPAALATGIGSDTQGPFAIVIVAGLISRLFTGFFVNPVLYEMVAREGDVLQV